MTEKIIVYMLIPLCEYDRFHKGEVVSYCKIGQTSAYRYSENNYLDALYTRTNNTCFPEMMIAVGYILSDKNITYVDDYVRKKLLENSNRSTLFLSSQFRIKNHERKNNPIIVNSGNEFVYNVTKSDLENLKDKLYDMNIHKFCIYDKCDIDYRKLPIYESYRYMLKNKDEDDKQSFINVDLLDICNKFIDVCDRYKQELENEIKDKENEIKDKEIWKDKFLKLLNLYLLYMVQNKKDLNDVEFSLPYDIDSIKNFSLEQVNEGIKNPVIVPTQNHIKNNKHYPNPKPRCKEDITKFIVPGMSQNEIVQMVMEKFGVRERTARTYLKKNGLTRPYRTKEVEGLCEVVEKCSTDIKDKEERYDEEHKEVMRLRMILDSNCIKY